MHKHAKTISRDFLPCFHVVISCQFEKYLTSNVLRTYFGLKDLKTAYCQIFSKLPQIKAKMLN